MKEKLSILKDIIEKSIAEKEDIAIIQMNSQFYSYLNRLGLIEDCYNCQYFYNTDIEVIDSHDLFEVIYE